MWPGSASFPRTALSGIIVPTSGRPGRSASACRTARFGNHSHARMECRLGPGYGLDVDPGQLSLVQSASLGNFIATGPIAALKIFHPGEDAALGIFFAQKRLKNFMGERQRGSYFVH